MDIIKVVTLVVIALVFIAGLIILIPVLIDDLLDMFDSGKPRKGRVKKALTLKKTPSSPPVIGYKKANYMGSGLFRGVVGSHYKVVDSSTDKHRGFHSYAYLDRAINHAQYGNCLLEVLSYGSVDKLDLGYESTEQRILQVLTHHCNISGCDKVAAYFHGQRHDFLCVSHVLYEDLEYVQNFAELEEQLNKSQAMIDPSLPRIQVTSLATNEELRRINRASLKDSIINHYVKKKKPIMIKKFSATIGPQEVMLSQEQNNSNHDKEQ